MNFSSFLRGTNFCRHSGQVSNLKGALLTRRSQGEMPLTLDCISHSSAQTQRLGVRLGELVQGGELILLDGQLGTGKTTFTQGLAQGLGIVENINSPTFTLLKEYMAQTQSGDSTGALSYRRLALYHFDLYRLDNPDEIADLGFEDYFFSDGISVIEWAEKAASFWPEEHLNIRLKMMSETKRGLLFIANGEHYRELLRQFQKNAYVTTGS